MKIHVGSKNITKIQAVTDAIKLYPKLFPQPEIRGIDVNVPLFGHPKNLRQTIQGAIKRAKAAFVDCTYSIGLEGGLMKAPHTQTGYLETGACALYDGKKVFIGLSPAFEWPQKVLDLILSNKADASQAVRMLGLTHHEKLGAQPGGIIGVLTDGKITRESFAVQSIIMAIIQLEKPEFFV